MIDFPKYICSCKLMCDFKIKSKHQNVVLNFCTHPIITLILKTSTSISTKGKKWISIYICLDKYIVNCFYVHPFIIYIYFKCAILVHGVSLRISYLGNISFTKQLGAKFTSFWQSKKIHGSKSKVWIRPKILIQYRSNEKCSKNNSNGCS
jgi:hypothetical protein